MLATNFISDLEKAIAERSAHTAAMLRQITDLFLANAGQYSTEQVGVYDDVLQLLIAKVDSAARATLARRAEDDGDVEWSLHETYLKASARVKIDRAARARGGDL